MGSLFGVPLCPYGVPIWGPYLGSTFGVPLCPYGVPMWGPYVGSLLQSLLGVPAGSVRGVPSGGGYWGPLTDHDVDGRQSAQRPVGGEQRRYERMSRQGGGRGGPGAGGGREARTERPEVRRVRRRPRRDVTSAALRLLLFRFFLFGGGVTWDRHAGAGGGKGGAGIWEGGAELSLAPPPPLAPPTHRLPYPLAPPIYLATPIQWPASRLIAPPPV